LFIHLFSSSRASSLRQRKRGSMKWIVWVGGCDDHYVNYEDAKKAFDQWIEDGYDDVKLEEV